MISVRIEEKPAFRIVGRKTWIPGTENEAFGQFWKQCGENGLFDLFNTLREGNKPGVVTEGMYLGVSCVQDDPSNRSFFFYIAIESDRSIEGLDLEEFSVSASKWAIFRNTGPMPDSLIEAEMYAFTQWLPNSGYVHANAPEMEVYPPYDGPQDNMLSEFWLPIVEKPLDMGTVLLSN